MTQYKLPPHTAAANRRSFAYTVTVGADVLEYELATHGERWYLSLTANGVRVCTGQKLVCGALFGVRTKALSGFCAVDDTTGNDAPCTVESLGQTHFLVWVSL